MSGLVPDDYLPYLEYLPDLQKCANVFMTCTPLFSYGSTCYSIHRRKTSTGFSIDICATMFMAASLRILYYFITPYEVTLLRQSIMMIFIQSILLKVSLHYRPKNYDPEFLTPLPVFRNELNSSLPRRLSASGNTVEHESYYVKSLPSSMLYIASDLLKLTWIYIKVSFAHALKFFDIYYQRPYLFWQWKEEMPYWRYIAQFIGVFSILTLVFNNNQTFGNFIGILGLFIESLLPLPQILLLNRLGSVKNFKVILLLSWLGGDLTKIGYLLYGTDNVSIIFIVAGLFQMSLDIFIAWQYVHFKSLELKAAEYAENPESLNSSPMPDINIYQNSVGNSTDLNDIVNQLITQEQHVQPDQSIELRNLNTV